jgi:hypothetical protein
VFVGLDHLGTVLAGWDHHFDAKQVITGQTHASREQADTPAEEDASYAGGRLSSGGNGVTHTPQRLHHRPLFGAGLHGSHPRALINVDLVHIAYVDDHPTIHRGPPF